MMNDTVICPICASIVPYAGADEEAWICSCGWVLPLDVAIEIHRERQEFP
jgi:hypothetical protein